jgi:hypothetical protein
MGPYEAIDDFVGLFAHSKEYSMLFFILHSVYNTVPIDYTVHRLIYCVLKVFILKVYAVVLYCYISYLTTLGM